MEWKKSQKAIFFTNANFFSFCSNNIEIQYCGTFVLYWKFLNLEMKCRTFEKLKAIVIMIRQIKQKSCEFD